tara:strand:+ start:72 stop:341 length:270 start_codon:yes stop_codon:yes gene_type:complete
MTIEITTGGYGFAHNWILDAYGKKFYLGQDVKFCQRVLGMDTSYVVSKIGSNDLRSEKTRNKLARFICDELGVNRRTVNDLESWSLCSQ